jgi:hypothetical protein
MGDTAMLIGFMILENREGWNIELDVHEGL